MAKGPLIIVSGPSGSGKSTAIQRLLAEGGLPLRLSVSATTRRPRKGEIDGVQYHFWTLEDFQEHVRAGEFLEYAQVHDKFYGTLRNEVDPFREQGIGVILDIDVQGADQVRRTCPDNHSIFLKATTWHVYEDRLRQRGTESEAAIALRLETAKRELNRQTDYDHIVENDDLATTVATLRSLIGSFFPLEDEHRAR